MVLKVANYKVLRNNSDGPVLCAMDQPDLVRTDIRSQLQCSSSCLGDKQCISFNYKDVLTAGAGYTCEHFNGYPSNFTTDPTCRHYGVRVYVSISSDAYN